MKAKALFVLTLLVFASTFLVFGGTPILLHVGSQGNVKASIGLEVRDNQGLHVLNIPWGEMTNGSSYSQTYNLWNTGNTPITVTMNHTLSPSIGTFTWDSEGSIIPQWDFIAVTFTLNVASHAPSGDFSFDIMLTGTG